MTPSVADEQTGARAEDAAARIADAVTGRAEINDQARRNCFQALKMVDARTSWQILVDWTQEGRPALQGIRKRQDLAHFINAILLDLSVLSDSERILLRFDGLLQRMPPDTGSIAKICADAEVRQRLMRVLALSPRLVDTLIASPDLVERLGARNFDSAEWNDESLSHSLAAAIDHRADLAATVATCRKWLNARHFALGAALIEGVIDGSATGASYTAAAEVAIDAVLSSVKFEFERQHGRLPGQRFAILALGKLGGREMTVGSDLDLVLVYDLPDLHVVSDGQHALASTLYFSRLGNALVAALTRRLGAEAFFEIDVRLSPWARKSVAATHFKGLRDYYAAEAWTWELMALTRARPIAGDSSLRTDLQTMIQDILTRARPAAPLVHDVHDMRQRIARNHQPEPPWDVKRRPGGLVDCEFIVQFRILGHAAERPDILATDTETAIDRLADAKVLDVLDASVLRAAVRFWSALSAVVRLTVGATPDVERHRHLVAEILTRQGLCRDLTELEDKVAKTSQRVGDIYARQIETPAMA